YAFGFYSTDGTALSRLIVNVRTFAFFTLVTDLLTQWMSGKRIRRLQAVLTLPLGAVMGGMTVGGSWVINAVAPAGVPLPAITAAALLLILGLTWGARLGLSERLRAGMNRGFGMRV